MTLSLIPLLIILLLLSALFSGSETALLSLRRTHAKRMENGTFGERAAINLLKDSQKLFGTIVVGNMFVNIWFASIIAKVCQDLFDAAGVAVAACVSTLLLLLVGEVTPKSVAVQFAAPYSRLAAPFLFLCTWILWPFRLLARLATNTVLRLLGQSTLSGTEQLTPEEIESVFAMGLKHGAAKEHEVQLLGNILQLSRIEAHEIMLPRPEVTGIADSATVADAFKLSAKCRHSRLPIYTEDMDDIWGIFSIVDIPSVLDTDMMNQTLAELRTQLENEQACLEELPLYLVMVYPETVSVEHLLNEMRQKKAPMVVLVDEYGGTAGILTLDDILEELVGQISPGNEIADVGAELPGSVRVVGTTHVREVGKMLNVEVPDATADTIGGYVMELLERVPRTGDKVSDSQLSFKVIKMAGRRVDTLKIERVEVEE